MYFVHNSTESGNPAQEAIQYLPTVATIVLGMYMEQQVSGHGVVLFLVSLSLNKRVSDVTMKKTNFTEIDRVKYPTG